MGFLVIDCYNDLWLGSLPGLSSVDFYTEIYCINLCLLRVSYVYCPRCLRLVKAAGLKERVGIKTLKKHFKKYLCSW